MKQRLYPRVRVQGDGRQVVSRAGSVLLVETVRKTGLDRALSAALAPRRQPRAVHDPGKILLALAPADALGGDCLADLATPRAEPAMFGPVASDPTVSRLIGTLATTGEKALTAIRSARSEVRGRVWELSAGRAPDADGRVTADLEEDLRPPPPGGVRRQRAGRHRRTRRRSAQAGQRGLEHRHRPPRHGPTRPRSAAQGDILIGWPKGLRLMVRKERPHPGAQSRITDADGMLLTCFVTNTAGCPIAELELRHRLRARAEDRIRAARATVMRNLPLHDTAQNKVRLEIVQIALDLPAWMPMLALTGKTRLREPRRLRFRLFSAAAQLVTTGRRRILRLARHWPWTGEIADALARPGAHKIEASDRVPRRPQDPEGNPDKPRELSRLSTVLRSRSRTRRQAK